MSWDIVDHNHIHAARDGFQPSAFGEDFRRRDAGGVVDINLTFFEFIAGQHELFPFGSGKLSGKSLGHTDVGIRAKEPLHDLNAGHFQREYGTDLIFMQSGMLDEVHGERSLSHTGTGGENDEVGGLKSVRHLIQPFESRLYCP